MLAELLRDRNVMPIWDDKAGDWESRRCEIVQLI